VSFTAWPSEARSLRLQVTEALRQAVIRGRMQPGDRVIEEDIARQMRISRGPVREALRQLEQEGLVQSFPYRGTVVIGVSNEEFEHVLVPIRLTLERFAFRHALAHLTDEDLVALDRLVRMMRDAVERDDLPCLVESDVQFHGLVIARSGQHHTVQMWHTISPRIRAYFYRMGPWHRDLIEIAQEHQDLLVALRTRDAEQVLTVLDHHIVHINVQLEIAKRADDSGSQTPQPGQIARRDRVRPDDGGAEEDGALSAQDMRRVE